MLMIIAVALLVAGLFAPSLAKFISSGGILKLGTRTDTVFAHDTINVDPASGHQEDDIASDGTETAAEPAEATENIFRDKRNTRKAVRAPKFGKLVVHPLILRLTGISMFAADDGIPIFGILAIIVPPVVSAVFAFGITIYSQGWLFRSYSKWSNLVAGE